MTMPLTEEQITALLNDPTNEDFFHYINDMRSRKSWSSRTFASELKTKFPDVDDKHDSRINKSVDQFMKDYKTKESNAQQRAERILKLDTLYLPEGGSFKCTICDEKLKLVPLNVFKSLTSTSNCEV